MLIVGRLAGGDNGVATLVQTMLGRSFVADDHRTSFGEVVGGFTISRRGWRANLVGRAHAGGLNSGGLPNWPKLMDPRDVDRLEVGVHFGTGGARFRNR